MSIRLLHVAETLRRGISAYPHEILPEQVREFVVLPRFICWRLKAIFSIYQQTSALPCRRAMTVAHAHSPFAGLDTLLDAIKLSPTDAVAGPIKT